jgi:D-alanyl-D-alanine carboxypeptidase
MARIVSGDLKARARQKTRNVAIKIRHGEQFLRSPNPGRIMVEALSKFWRPGVIVKAAAFKRPPLFAPGKEFDYCNTNYALLGLVAEKVEGGLLANVFQNRFFGALGEHIAPCQHVERNP